MKHLNKLITITSLALCSSAHAATMQFDMSAYDLDISAGTLDVILSVSDLASGTQGGSEAIAYNDAVLEVTNVAFGADYFGFFTPTADTSVAGSIVLDHPTLIFGGLPANSVIATITFNILGTGFSDLTLTSPGAATTNPWAYNDPQLGAVPYCITYVAPAGGTCEVILPSGPAETQAMVLNNSSVTISAIPIPPAVWLFGTGLLGLVAIARRKTQAV